MIKEHILVELKQFVYAIASRRGIRNITSAQVVRSSLNLLEDLPAAREVVLEYFALTFDVSVGNYVSFLAKEPQGTPPEDEYITDIQEALENLVTKGPAAWSPLIASWSLDLVGKLSDKYWPSRKLDIGAACNFWLNCGAMRSLLGLVASCFRKLTNAEAEICVGTLLATFRKYSTTFDWVVARLGGCFPMKIISQILQCGLKRFSEDVRCRFDSEIGILDYLSFAHEKDLKHAVKELLEDGFNPKKPVHVDIIPYLMQVASYSEVILQPIVSVFLDLYNDLLLESIVRQTPFWMQNSTFRDMQPSLNNIALKIKSNGGRLLLTVSSLAEKFAWCQDFIEYTLQELEQCILLNRSCPLLTDLSTDESKALLWKSCLSANFLEQQTAVRLILIVSTQFPHIYHQTFAELLSSSYEINKTSVGALIRVIGGLSGLVEFPDIKPGLEMALERILIQKEFHNKEKDMSSLNTIKNLITIARLEKTSSSPFLKQQPIGSALMDCFPKLLNILDCVLGQLMDQIENFQPNDCNIVAADAPVKRQKLESMEIDEDFNDDRMKQAQCAVLVHKLMALLDCMEAGAKTHVIGTIEVLKLAHLTIKYFFWSLTERCKPTRLTAVNHAFSLLQRQCSARKAARSACLRDLVEGALFHYNNLFGAYDEILDSEETGIAENEKLILLNQKQGLGPNANRSVLHAGIIGKGLKAETPEKLANEPDPELQSLLMKAIDSCSQDQISEDYIQQKANSFDAYSTVSLLLVEMVSSDVMYNGLPFPDEEFTKVTMERDLQIRRTFKTSPILWAIISLVAAHRPAFCFSSVLLRALCASFLHQWRAKNVNKYQPPHENEELLTATKRLLQILAMGQLLPPPLCHLHMIIEFLDAPEIALVLKECIWNYLKDNVPAPALFHCTNGLHWRNPALSKPPPQYVDTLRNIMQKKLPKLGSYYHLMFSLPALELKDDKQETQNV